VEGLEAGAFKAKYIDFSSSVHFVHRRRKINILHFELNKLFAALCAARAAGALRKLEKRGNSTFTLE